MQVFQQRSWLIRNIYLHIKQPAAGRGGTTDGEHQHYMSWPEAPADAQCQCGLTFRHGMANLQLNTSTHTSARRHPPSAAGHTCKLAAHTSRQPADSQATRDVDTVMAPEQQGWCSAYSGLRAAATGGADLPPRRHVAPCAAAASGAAAPSSDLTRSACSCRRLPCSCSTV